MHCTHTVSLVLAGIGRWRVVPTFGALVHGALGFVLCLLPLLAGAQTLRFTQALAVAADTEYFPAELPQVQTVELPDDWASSRPDSSGRVWYRLASTPMPCAPAASCRRCTSNAPAAPWRCG